MRFALALFAASLAAAPMSNIVQLDPSGTAALDSAGRVWTWGPKPPIHSNRPNIQLVPRVAAQSASFRKIAKGNTHFLALRDDGTVCSWGSSTRYALGLGGVTSVEECTTIAGLDGVRDIAATGENSYALKLDGTVWVWGEEAYPVGDALLNTPLPAQALSGVRAIAPNLALRADGTVWMWGRFGRERFISPTPVPGLSSVSAIFSNRLAGFAIRTDGTVWAWGLNSARLFGPDEIVANPTQITALPGPVASVAAGNFHALALLTDGSLWAWGVNHLGQLGNGSREGAGTPIRVTRITGGISVAAGPFHSAVLVADGTLRTWGDNTSGELGLGTAGQPFALDITPAPVAGLDSVTTISVGESFSLALRNDGTVWSWGSYGPALGDCSSQYRPRAAPSSVSGVTAISAGRFHALGLLQDGRVVAWGSNSFYELGDGTTTSRCAPQAVPGLTGVIAIAAGASHSVALKSDGTVWTWGRGAYGQSSNADIPTPVRVTELSGISAISAGSSSLAIQPGGSVARWRTDFSDFLPTVLPGLSGVTAISAALGQFDSSLAIGPDGQVWWLRVPSPFPVPALGSGVIQVDARPAHPIALKADRSVWAWEPTKAARQIAGLSAIQAISGFRHNLALDLAGRVYSWGENAFGQLGRGQSPVDLSQTTPVTVPALPAIPDSAVSPSSGSGARRTFNFRFHHNAGASSVSVANVLINNVVDGRNACYLAFLPSGPSAGTLVLVDDAGQAGGPFAGSLWIPGPGSISNGQCTVFGAGSSVQSSGLQLTLTLDIAFSQSFAGGKVAYLATRDSADGNSGWVPQGVWNVPTTALVPQRIESLTISSAFFPVYELTVTHASGATNLEIINILINDAIDGRRACYLAFLPSTGAAYLVNNEGDAGGPFAGSAIPSVSSAGNGQCLVNGELSASVAGNTLRLQLPINLYSTRATPWIVYAAARDRLGNNTGWQPMAVVQPN